jgi:hypothetical protein
MPNTDAWDALVEYRARLEEEDEAIQRINRTDPYVVASIFGAGFNAGRERLGKESSDGD